ncbi:MAG: hypothetical protein PQJ58_06775 [Spirochaetales bacterium]|nr:hypothetical protein [Spirochaetales bacterium]
MNVFRYNPVSSFLHCIVYVLKARIAYPRQNIGQEHILKDSGQFRTFLEIDILDRNKKKKKGQAVFRIIFHAPRVPVQQIIRRTRFTIPFFSGLPGFCTKQFMVNAEKRQFSGRYEWETVEMAQNYARSYAVRFMKRRSRPFPIYYEITDKSTDSVVESGSLKTAKGRS